jgi:amidase
VALTGIGTASLMLYPFAGKDEHDKYTSSIPFDEILDYAASCRSTSLKGARLGIPRNAFSDVEKPVIEAFEEAVKILRENGATIVDNADFTGLDEYRKLPSWSQDIVLFTDFKDTIASYLGSFSHNPDNLHTLQDLINWTHRHPEGCWPVVRYNCL